MASNSNKVLIYFKNLKSLESVRLATIIEKEVGNPTERWLNRIGTELWNSTAIG